VKILIAGIGNIFLGDDGFGVEVARRLMREPWPEGVSVTDFGIRGFDLACALLEDYDAFILIDAYPRGEAPGTLCGLEIDCTPIGGEQDAIVFDAHALDPLQVLKTVRAMGGSPKRVLLVGCEPKMLNEEQQLEGCMGLSEPVQAAIQEAIAMVRSLVNNILEETKHERPKAFEDACDYSSGGAGDYAVAGH
jgi:hydrogenase maturation protease